eukprot:TRINITY_DN26502_c0_g2_i2.p2 TRINITY_DN26502_c0_g2~~TRINITY_DN26502_c0_g2_i2.p2  ORF type:complete len:175 (-),score=19.99 TRINITY_DN26502_c0_g2_i2:73-531(-)
MARCIALILAVCAGNMMMAAAVRQTARAPGYQQDIAEAAASIPESSREVEVEEDSSTDQSSHMIPDIAHRHCFRGNTCFQLGSVQFIKVKFICKGMEVAWGSCADAGNTCEKNPPDATSYRASPLMKLINLGVSTWLPKDSDEKRAGCTHGR